MKLNVQCVTLVASTELAGDGNVTLVVRPSCGVHGEVVLLERVLS